MSPELSFCDTPNLRVAYEESGPGDGVPVLLLHGFPYDIRQYDEVRKHLAGSNLRFIVPYLRGFGPTRYVSQTVPRSGQQAALGADIVAMLDALRIDKAFLVGYDWGGRGACVAAALWPERVSGLLSVGGYTIQNIATSAKTPESAEQEHQFWYQWYFHTERGRLGLETNRKELCRLLWKMWSPHWSFTETEFDDTARSFDNPDFVTTVVHSYKHRYGNAPGDPMLEPLEEKLAAKPPISVPTIVLHGRDDQVDPPSRSEDQQKQFIFSYERRIIKGAGHCLPAEAPVAVSHAVCDLARSES
jgi:pimeloyl-ACP methyl ester carboxylesterase